MPDTNEPLHGHSRYQKVRYQADQHHREPMQVTHWYLSGGGKRGKVILWYSVVRGEGECAMVRYTPFPPEGREGSVMVHSGTKGRETLLWYTVVPKGREGECYGTQWYQSDG